MDGQGPAPVQELAVSRSLVFTGPQDNINTLNFLTLNGTAEAERRLVAAGRALLPRLCPERRQRQHHRLRSLHRRRPASCASLTASRRSRMRRADACPTSPTAARRAIGENDYRIDSRLGPRRHVAASLRRSPSAASAINSRWARPSTTPRPASTPARRSASSIRSCSCCRPTLIVDTPENSDAAIANGDPTPVSVDSVNKNLGIYVTDTLNVTPDLAVTASGRYNIAHIDLYDQLGTNLDGYNRFVHFNPAIGATYKLAAHDDALRRRGRRTRAHRPRARSNAPIR